MAEQLKISNGASDKNGITFYIRGICYGIRASIGKYGEIRTDKIVKINNNSIFLMLAVLGLFREVMCWFGITNWLYHIPSFIFVALTFFGVGYMLHEKETRKYHGAEHMSIYCYENDLELTVENARKFTRLHPRCGTNFLFNFLICNIPFIYILFVYIHSI